MSKQVFAFGSNMCSARFRDYGVTPEGEGRAAKLPGYRLAFNKPSRDGSGKATLLPEQDAWVWGVLYTIADADLETLDRGEGPGYARLPLTVRLADCSTTTAWVYLASRPSNDPSLRPYTWYKEFLVAGAREHDLPAEYIANLERIEATQDSDGQRDREKRALVCRVVP